jgi:hypothetical protein
MTLDGWLQIGLFMAVAGALVTPLGGSRYSPVRGPLRLQAWLPLNPQLLKAIPPDLAYNTAGSFVTNTNWQSYTGGSTLHYLSRMMGITAFSYLSAVTGIALPIALIRGFARRGARKSATSGSMFPP